MEERNNHSTAPKIEAYGKVNGKKHENYDETSRNRSRCNDFFTDIVVTYFTGTKPLAQLSPIGKDGGYVDANDKKTLFSYFKFSVGLLWLGYMMRNLFEIHLCFQNLFLSDSTPIYEMRTLKTFSRLLVYVCNFATYALYPVFYFMLLKFHSMGLLERSREALISDCGVEYYNRIEEEAHSLYLKDTDIIMYYHQGFLYAALQSMIHFVILTSAYYPFGQCVFWSFELVPHALNSYMLLCHISHVITIFNGRIKWLIKEVRSNESNRIDSADKLFDLFLQFKKEAFELSQSLTPFTSICGLSLMTAMVLELVSFYYFFNPAVHGFNVAQNIVFFMIMCNEAVKFTEEFVNLMETIINLSTSSVLGSLGSPERANMLMTIQRPQSIPALYCYSEVISLGFLKNSLTLLFSILFGFLMAGVYIEDYGIRETCQQFVYLLLFFCEICAYYYFHGFR